MGFIVQKKKIKYQLQSPVRMGCTAAFDRGAAETGGAA
jgi:hypothetical protein